MMMATQTACIPHYQRTYQEEKEYFNTKTSMYEQIFGKVCDITQEINAKGFTTLAEKEQIAKGLTEGSEYSISVSESCFDNTIEHKVHINLSENEWNVHMGIVWIVDQTQEKKDPRAVRLFADLGDCDLQIEYDDDDQLRLAYVESPRENEDSYKNEEHCMWNPEIHNINPFCENWCIDSFHHTEQSFDKYAEDFGIVDMDETMPEIVDYCMDMLEDKEERSIDEFIVREMLNSMDCCTDLIPGGYVFDVERDTRDLYGFSFYITCTRHGRQIHRSGLIRKTWVEEPSRKRKSLNDPEA
jgi:hypothetical protein